MAIQRIPLSQPIETRDGTLSTDSKCVNGYFESRNEKREFIKRPGLSLVTTTPVIPSAQGQGMYLFNSYLYAVVNNVLYKINPTTYAMTTVGTLTGTVNGAVANAYFTQTLNNGYLFLHNQVNGYLVNGSTGAFTQITNDRVATTTILTGGTGYSNGATVTFSAPSSGVTATGTLLITGGVITGITITNSGSGYTTAPTITFTPAATVSGVTVTNTSGTNTLTAASITGTVYVGMAVTGTGIQSGTTVTAIAGTGPYTITLSSITTSAVTSATFTDLGAYATATSLLNFFPTGGLVPGACFLDSYIVVGTPSGRIYTSNVNDPTIWNPLDYISLEGDPDNLVGISKHLNYILGFGQWSTELFYDAGNPVASPLGAAPSYKVEIGCANGDSIVQFEQSVLWIGVSKATGAGIYLMDGTAPVKVSTVYIDRILGNSNLSEIKAYTFKFNGHMFYVLTLADLNVTIVFDVNERMWYQWTMFAIGDSSSGITGIYAEQYFRPSFFAGYGSQYFVLDDDNGSLYLMSDTYYNDAGAPIYYRAVTDLIDNGTTKRKFYNRVEIVGDKVSAIMNIRHSDNDYVSWSPYRTVDLHKGRSQIYQTGAARRRAWEFLCTDNQPLRLDCAEIDFSIGELDNEGGSPTQYRK